MQQWRINLIFGLLFVFGLVLVGKLFFIQVLHGDFYKALAQGLYNVGEDLSGERGEIFFKNQEPLAINMEWPLVFASPRLIEEKEKTAEILASALGLNETEVLEKLQRDNLYELLKKKLSDEEVNFLEENSLLGIYSGKESGRYYPQESFASQLSGFLDADKAGQYGLEGHYDEILQEEKRRNGDNLVLSIDYSIQFMAEELLKWAEESLNAEGGEIIVIDPNSGRILALANYPNFNPNQYSAVSDIDVFQNSAIQKIFEPGSVFKPITMAAAMEEGKVTSQTTYFDQGCLEISGYDVCNYKKRIYPGELTMTNVLEKSINTGAVFAEQQLGQELFFEYIEKFGLFEKTGIDIQETIPENKEFHEAREQGREINFATAAFGQGIEMTPIQLVRAYSVIANGGRLVRPYVVEKVVQKEKVIEVEPKFTLESVISPKTASQITAMMVSVVENGFAKSAQIPGYYVAGKTGTAQIAFSALGVAKSGYSDKTWQSFVGFAPAFNPQFLILVKLNNPETGTAEYSAVPIFHDLAKYIIDYYQIPPDYEVNK